ncbi:MAG: hypothetical protein ACM3N9_00005, partial [Syntrophothermus sp.]
MKKFTLFLFLSIFLLFGKNVIMGQDNFGYPPNYQPDTRIDNMGYWRKMAALGLVPVAPVIKVPAAQYTGSKVFDSKGVLIDDSQDIPVTTELTTQSENSIVVDPDNNAFILNSNNSTPQPSGGTVYGADYYMSDDEGATWSGSKQGAGGSNSGDPAACINIAGRYFIGFIDAQNGQSVSYSDDKGLTWTMKKVANGTVLNMLDKNHLWVDVSPASPFKGNLYNGWMVNNNINVSRSITNGTSWEPSMSISAGTNAGSHNQGENFKCGPDGEVYCVWSVYDSWPSDEKALGFSKSLDGGITWSTATRILNNIKGIRNTGVSQNMRTNSFPSMACDISNSPNRGALYVVWANVGVPGTNTGPDVDVYMIKSMDKGVTWSTPKRINNDPTGAGKKHYLPWIACDQANGNLAIVFYDNRNVSATQCETWMAYSTDGGNTFENMKVSDVSFTPSPIPGLATGYMGDYLSISGYNGKFFPCWADTRLGYPMTYVSPITLLLPAPKVIYNENILNDTLVGNNNGNMDYGETCLLGLKLKNEGTAIADSVDVTLTSESPYITMIDSTEYYGDFAMGGSKVIYSDFKFQVSDSVPNGQWIPFLVKSRYPNDSVTVSTFSLYSHAPAVSILSMNIEDPLGNNNGRLDPGETATIRVTTQNTGSFPAINAVSELTSSNPFIQVMNPVQNIGTLAPGQTVIVDFTVSVHPATRIGPGVMFHNYAHAQTQFDQKDWLVKVGLIVEDWETGNFTKFPWQFNGDANWRIDTVHWEKIYSAQSGAIGDNKTSGLFISYNVLYDDTIFFHRKTSTQPLADKFGFYVDGAMLVQSQGNQAWKDYAFPVTAGPHVFEWRYTKDASISTGADACWVDYIIFPPEYQMNIFAGNNATSCGSQPYPLQGLAVNYDSLLWSSSGTGNFDNPANISAIYTPSAEDITAGSVDISLTAWSNGQSASNSFTLTFETAPQVSAGSDQVLCAAPVELSTSAASGFSALQWNTSGDGTFDNATSLHPVYTPGAQDITQGHADLTLNVTPSSASCEQVSDVVSLTFNPQPVVNLGHDTTLCEYQTITLVAAIPNASSYTWSTGETGSMVVIDSTGTGIGTKMVSVVATDHN